MTEKITTEFARFLRQEKGFSLVIADIDYFKKINDTYGHMLGDSVLQSIAGEFVEAMREYDTVARWGGEEFLFLLPDTDLAQAQAFSERLRKVIAEKSYVYGEIEVHITLTFGVSSIRSGEAVDDLIKRVDDALYEGKHAGRNCVVAR